MPTIPLDEESIRFHYERLEEQNRRYRENQLYSEGKNPQIHNMAPTKDPDNRLAIPLAKMAIADLSGYAGSLRTIEIDNVNTDETAREDAETDAFIEAVEQVYEFNNTNRLTSQLYREAITQGVAYEIVFTREQEGNRFFPEYAKVPRSQIMPIFSDELKPELLAFIWFREIENDRRRDVDGNTVTIADVYYGKNEIFMRNDDGEIVQSNLDGVIERWVMVRDRWERDPSGDSQHLFDRPPLNIYKINENEQSVFEAEKGLLFAIDKLLSKSINEVDRFNSNILITSGPLNDEDLAMIQQWSIMIGKQSSDESDPFYLSKNLGDIDNFYNLLADRLERLFHKSAKVPDFSDENFVGNSSGVALAFKLLGLEFLATEIDSFFDEGVRQRYDLIIQALNFVQERFDPNEYILSIRNQRNLPVDNETRARIAQTLLPIISRETLLRFLPNEIVDDAQRELERLAAEGAATLPDINLEDDVVDA